MTTRCRTVLGVSHLLALGALLVPALSFAQQASTPAQSADLTKMNLEDLMNIQVTSASRREQTLSEIPAAIFVITRDDIRCSGATNIPDLLRIVPGVQVAQINASAWAISVRGFNGRFSNKALIMVDGRTVYTPLFAGVFWDTLDVPLEDIERIEVIRGPGGSIWGANAVDGVINIITKDAASTAGTLVTLTGGSSGKESLSLRHGGNAPRIGHYRVFAGYSADGSLRNPAGALADDDWHLLHAGFRIDSQLAPKDSLSLQGDLYTGREGVNSPLFTSLLQSIGPLFAQVNLSGGFFESTWNHHYSSHSDTTLVASYQQYERSDLVSEFRGTFELDFHHNLSLGERHQLVWGTNYRHSASRTIPGASLSFVPDERETSLFGAFIEDQFALVPSRLDLVLGTKLERNHYTGFGVMPTARLAWTPHPNTTLWAAISRSLRTPSDYESSMRIDIASFTAPDGTPVIQRAIGTADQLNETLLAYESGARFLVTARLSVDLSTYFNGYHHLVTYEPSAPFFEPIPAPPHLVYPLNTDNRMYGESHGFEASTNWQVTGRWTLSPGYAFERIHLHLDPQSLDQTSIASAGEGTPAHSAQLRSRVELSSALKWDVSAYFVDRLVSPSVPSYTRLDTGLSWQPRQNLTIGVYGQNLLRDHHLEFVDSTNSTGSSLMKRRVFARISWQL